MRKMTIFEFLKILETANGDEVLELIHLFQYGYIVRYDNGEESTILHDDAITTTCFRIASGKNYHVTDYLICNPHPMLDMIIRWADTGQPVWIRPKDRLERPIKRTRNIPWDYVGYEYSFTPFGEEECEG